MKEIKRNIWSFLNVSDAIVIPTNGFVKKNGENVMGAGLAKQASTMFPTLPKMLAVLINTNGNITQLMYQDPNIVSFPVKPSTFKFDGFNGIRGACSRYSNRRDLPISLPGWMSKADLNLIETSAKQLVVLANSKKWRNTVVLPRVGCGLGELNWSVVNLILQRYLDYRFIICYSDDFRREHKE